MPKIFKHLQQTCAQKALKVAIFKVLRGRLPGLLPAEGTTRPPQGHQPLPHRQWYTKVICKVTSTLHSAKFGNPDMGVITSDKFGCGKSYSDVDDRHVREQLLEPGVQNDALLDVPACSFHVHAVDVGSVPRCRPTKVHVLVLIYSIHLKLIKFLYQFR